MQTELSKKKPVTLDSLPEDVAHVIARNIKSWAEIPTSRKERDQGRRARDSALRAASLLNTKAFDLYFTSLIQDLTLAPLQVLSFLQALQRRNPSCGSLVKSLRLIPVIADRDTVEERENLFVSQASFFSTLSTSASPSQRVSQGLQIGHEKFFDQLSNLQTLVIECSAFGFPHFHHHVDEKLVPHAFLTNSLKKLFIQPWSGESKGCKLSASNVVWLLVFCRQIDEVSLAFEFDSDDFNYCSEFSTHYDGLSSIKKLALHGKFVDKEYRRTWGLPSHKDKKTQAIIHLLRCTKQLRALEVSISADDSKSYDRSYVSHSFISSLSKSFHSLKHLRLLGLIFSSPQDKGYLDRLKELSILTLSYSTVFELGFIDPPPKLEVLYLPFHMRETLTQLTEKDFEEEIGLARFLDSGAALPHLEEVLVPSSPISSGGDCLPQTKTWMRKRSKLEEANIFKNGKVKLRKVQIGETFVGEPFMSTVPWISDF